MNSIEIHNDRCVYDILNRIMMPNGSFVSPRLHVVVLIALLVYYISSLTISNTQATSAIFLTTDRTVYSVGDKVGIQGQVNSSGTNVAVVNIKVSKVAEERLGDYMYLKNPVVINDVSLVTDESGKFIYFTSFPDAGKYNVTAQIVSELETAKSFINFEVKNVFFSLTAKMLYGAIGCFLGLIAVIVIGAYFVNKPEKNKGLEKKQDWEKKQGVITGIETARFVALSGIAVFFMFALLFADTEIGVNSPVGLVRLSSGTVSQSGGQNPMERQETDWVINVGGNPNDNYRGGIQIPVWVVVFGILGGYFRYLYGMRFLFSEKRKYGYEDTDRRWGDLNIRDPLSFLKHSLRSLSLFFLSPLVAIAAWLILIQSGTTGKWAIAALSFTMGLITEEVILSLISFARSILIGIKEANPMFGPTEVDVKKPHIVIKEPTSGGISPISPITVQFDEELNRDSITNKIILRDNADNPVSGQTELLPDLKTLRFKPDAPLHPNENYIVELAKGIHDLSGNEADPIKWSFKIRDFPEA
jgi:hypothetical protein